MGRVLRVAAMVAGLGIGLIAVPPADASGARRAGVTTPEPSVFPQPRDPWRSWGVREELPRRVGPPHHRHGGSNHVPPATVWVPGQWVWDGATWVWWPGRWGVR